MNKPYWGLWTLLLVALLTFVVLSFWQDGITVGGLEIKTATFARDLGAEMTSRPAKDTDTLPKKAKIKPSENRVVNIPTPVVVQ